MVNQKGNELSREVAPRDLPDWLLAHGRNWITSTEVADLLQITLNEVPPIAARWRAKRHAFSPTRGAYVPIPPEFRSWGATPAGHFIDALMNHLGHAYYVGYLSAAEVYGAAHQRPQTFQVVTTGRLARRNFGRVRIEFIKSAEAARRPTIRHNTPTGTMAVSTPEVTVLDLVAGPIHGGGLSNVMTVIADLIKDGSLDAKLLARSSLDYPVTVRQRTGWLIERATINVEVNFDMTPLAKAVADHFERTPLLASGPRSGELDGRWNVIINTEVEPDL